MRRRTGRTLALSWLRLEGHREAWTVKIGGVLDHLSIQCADVPASAAFYDAVLAPLGGARIMDFGNVIGYGLPRRPTFWLGPLTTGEPNREIHIAFQAANRAAVRAFFDA